MSRELMIFSGNANLALAHEICAYLGVKLGEATVSSFSDGEIRIKIEENVRGADVYVVQSTCSPVNDSLMELLIIIDALKRSSAYRITAVMPYFGYARQDRKDQPRVPITAKLVADLITTAGADRVLTMDLHAGQIQGFFNVPVDHLYALPVLLDYITKKKVSDLVIVSPDAGGVERARAFAKRLQANLAIIDKRREGPNQTQIMNIIGDIKGKSTLLLDDMIDTAIKVHEKCGRPARMPCSRDPRWNVSTSPASLRSSSRIQSQYRTSSGFARKSINYRLRRCSAKRSGASMRMNRSVRCLPNARTSTAKRGAP
jgi:ribose-phosphate pyrophosphokinase